MVIPVARSVEHETVVDEVFRHAAIEPIRVSARSLSGTGNPREVRAVLATLADEDADAHSIEALSTRLSGKVIELPLLAGDFFAHILDVVEQLSRYAVADRGPRFVLPAPGLAPVVGGPGLAVVPFKSVIERADTIAYVHGRLRQLSDRVDEVFAASIAEIAAYDIVLADDMIDSWDGTSETVRAMLGCGNRVAPDCESGANRSAEQIWSDGDGEWWEGGRFVEHARLVSDDELRSRLQVAAIRTLWPEIERSRLRIAQWVATQPHIVERLRLPPAECEIGDLADAVQPRIMLTKPKTHQLLSRLRRVRNDLGHMILPSREVAAELQKLDSESARELE